MAKKPTSTESEPETETPVFTETLPDEIETSQETAVAPRAQTALAGPDALADMDFSAVRPPFITITHGVGASAENFAPGDLVLARDHLVCRKGEKIKAVILNLRQYYKQRLNNEEWNAGLRPATFDTEQAAIDAGFQTRWENNTGPDVSLAMDLTLLLRKPEDVVCPLFGIDIGDGHEYALATFCADKTCYRYVATDIVNIIRFKLGSSGVYSGLWDFSTAMSRPARTTGNKTHVGRFTFIETLPEETIKAIVSAMGTPAND